MLVGLTGYAGAGKDTAARFLTDTAGFRRVAFADKVRELAYAQNPRVGHSGSLRSVIDHFGWDTAKRAYPEVRLLLQNVGQAHREVFGEDFWVDRVLPVYRGVALDEVFRRRRIVVTDVRYPNEVRRVHDLGGIVIRVEREGVGPVNGHESERYVSGADFTVRNVEGAPAAMQREIKKIIDTLEEI